jgi:FG-GAP-like repeat
MRPRPVLLLPLIIAALAMGTSSLRALDIVVSGIEGVRVWHLHADGSLVDTGQKLSTAEHNAGGALGDLDGDGDLDWFGVRFDNAAPHQVWFNTGSSRFVRSRQAFGGDAPSWGAALGDLDGDHDLDAYVSTSGGDSGCPADEVWRNNGKGRFDRAALIGADCSSAAALIDVDADGDLDAVTANSAVDAKGFPTRANSGKVWRNDGNMKFGDSGQRLGNQVGRDVAAGDVDGDGDPDLVLVGSGSDSVWFNDGKGHFEDSGQRLGRVSAFGIALADLDGDGDLDAFTANADFHGNTVWINQGDGHFIDSGQALGNLLTLDVALADVDADHDIDAIVANRNSASDHDGAQSQIWLNDGAANFALSKFDLGRARARKVVVGDLRRRVGRRALHD